MRICLDLDGVLVNWSGGLCKLLEIDPYCKEARQILEKDAFIEGWKFGTTEQIEDKVIKAGYAFWEELELLPWARDVLTIVEQFGPVYFLTSPGPFHAGAHAKIDYILKHFKTRNYILTQHKYLCSKETHFLIDDMEFNIKQWANEGGPSFHWPNQWLLLKDPTLVKQTLEQLTKELKEWSR